MATSDRSNRTLEPDPVTLESDFSDYYDFYFDYDESDAHVFKRNRGSDLGHERVMDVLTKRRLPVPMHGLVKNLRPNKDALVVVYFGDTESPRNETCQVVPLSEAKVEYPECFAVEYVGQIGPPSVSYRIVHVGDRTWCIRYESNHPWSSHEGDVRITLCETHSLMTWRQEFALPLYALDFVDATEGRWNSWSRYNRARPFFVDMTRCPVLVDTPIETKLAKDDAANLIKDAVRRFRDLQD